MKESVSAVSRTSVAPATRRLRLPAVPPPDTPEGRIVALGVIVAAVYVLLLLADNTPLADRAASWIPLVLILGTIVVFMVGMMLGADFSRGRQFELELARTIAVHSGAGQTPEANSPLGRVLTEYLHTADEIRRHHRAHAYAAGPALWGAAAALVAAFFWGLGLMTGAIWLGYLAILVELPAVVCLSFSVAVLATATGESHPSDWFGFLTPRRWRRYERTNVAFDEAIASLPWLQDAREPFTSGGPGPTGSAPRSGPWSEAQA